MRLVEKGKLYNAIQSKKNCICHNIVEVKIQIYCTLIANEMEDELNIILAR
jgi:hypothetical protein